MRLFHSRYTEKFERSSAYGSLFQYPGIRRAYYLTNVESHPAVWQLLSPIEALVGYVDMRSNIAYLKVKSITSPL
jgi:hypothetical protein